jgi:hypothetical protein
MLQKAKPPPAAADRGYRLGCFFGHDFGHLAMVPECPTFSSWDISGGHRRFDLSPGAMGRESNHGVPDSGAGAAGLAGRVRICGRADRYSPSGRRLPRQNGRAITPLADRLGPLIAPCLEPMPNRFARVGSGEHGHGGGDAQVGQAVRMCGVIGREIDGEAGLDSCSDQTAVLDYDGVVTKNRLVRGRRCPCQVRSV